MGCPAVKGQQHAGSWHYGCQKAKEPSFKEPEHVVALTKHKHLHAHNRLLHNSDGCTQTGTGTLEL